MPLQKTLTFHAIVLIKSVFNKNQNHYFYNMFLEKCFNQLDKNIDKYFFHSIIILKFGEPQVAKKSWCKKKKKQKKTKTVSI